MIQLVSKDLPEAAQNRLDELQSQVDELPLFKERKEKAATLWKEKGYVDNKPTFQSVRDTLTEMCVSVEICNYCEQNEAYDIEHIAPKSFFPERGFVWDNYLLACKQCNTGYKLDKCDVLDDDGNLHQVKRGDEPPYKNQAFINPRVENPNDFMILNMLTYEFDVFPDLDKAQDNKANKTLDILQLNKRATLIEARKKAALYFENRIDRLIRIRKATTNKEIEQELSSIDDPIDEEKSVSENKAILTETFKIDIQTHQHPSVWYAIKIIQSKVHRKWIYLFKQLPEALTW